MSHPSGRNLAGPTSHDEVWIHVDNVKGDAPWAVQCYVNGELQYHRVLQVVLLGRFDSVFTGHEGRSPRLYFVAKPASVDVRCGTITVVSDVVEI